MISKGLVSSASQITFDSLAPNGASLIEMHLWSISLLEAINSLRELLAKSFFFDILYGIEKCIECENKCF
jgi:hypothetical protein